MARSRANRRFTVPGIHGELEVIVCSRRTIRKKAAPVSKDLIINGLYIEAEHQILIASEMGAHARVTTLYHELAHHVFDTSVEIEEERACDLVGGYMQRLVADAEFLNIVQQISVC